MATPPDFWSRRKARVAAEDKAAEAARVALTDAEDQARMEARSDAEVLQELDLPDPDTLVAGDDFTAFMAKAVPERLRRRALRKLWTSNPVLACVDGLNDYDDDYTVAAVCGADMKTAYQVGRGFIREVLENIPQADNAGGEPGAQQPEDTAPDPVATALAEPSQVSDADITSSTPSAPQDTPPPEPVPAPRPRMRFAFGDEATPQRQDQQT